MNVPESKRTLDVLQVILNLDIGGGQQVVRTLAEHLASDTCRPVVCSFRDGPLRQEIERAGIPVELLSARRHSILAFPWFVADMRRILRALTRLIQQYDIDVVQTHLLSTLAFLTLCLHFTTRVRALFWTFHSTNFMLMPNQLPRFKWLLGPKRYAHRLIYRLATRWVSGYIAVSDQVKANMVQVIGPIEDKITVIYNGVDLKAYGQPVDRAQVRLKLGLAPSTFVLMMVGTLREPKGHRYMIEAMSMLAPRYPDVHLVCVGEGELRQALENQVACAGLNGRVHFLGSRQDIPDLLAACDVFIIPSLWEGFSMALLEAMASRLPIVASEVSGTVQVITDGETGWLVPPRDASKLIQAIEQIKTDPIRSKEMGQTARRRVEAGFSATKQADEHLALYRRALRAGSKSQ